MKKSSHSGKQSNGMVDISDKPITKRSAMAQASLVMGEVTYHQLMGQGSPKGDVFETAKVAGIMAAKSTAMIIPLCHPLSLNKVNIHFESQAEHFKILITSEVHCHGRTGVEMEALCAVSTAALTIYDMMKWSDKGMEITGIKLMAKSGGKSGDFKRT